MISDIKAIIFDWGRTLADDQGLFPETESLIKTLAKRYWLGLASLVSPVSFDRTVDTRRQRIEESIVAPYFEIIRVTDQSKDAVLDEIVDHFGLSPNAVAIVDDRVIRGIAWGNRKGLTTIWLQRGKFAHELPNDETGQPTHTISSNHELLDLL